MLRRKCKKLHSSGLTDYTRENTRQKGEQRSELLDEQRRPMGRAALFAMANHWPPENHRAVQSCSKTHAEKNGEIKSGGGRAS